MSMHSVITRIFSTLGFEIRRLPRGREGKSGLDNLFEYAENLRGMIGPKQLLAYYFIAYSQAIQGNVVEIGAWQGRSTVALAGACRDSNNGIVHVIDHFQGNPGKEDYYVVNAKDLSDLQRNFEANIKGIGLSGYIQVHAMNSNSTRIDGPIRLLVIDAEHAHSAVLNDFNHFRNQLQPDALVIFDDYAPEFPGVLSAVNSIHQSEVGSLLQTFGKMAILKLC